MAKYFVDCVEEVGGCPSLLRTDCGTENVVIAGVQSFLRAECDDDLAGEKAHRYGPSTGNQWIEAWWSYYRRSCLTWWITFFKALGPWSIFTWKYTSSGMLMVLLCGVNSARSRLCEDSLEYTLYWPVKAWYSSQKTRWTIFSPRKLWCLRSLATSVSWKAWWSQNEI